MFFSFDGVDGVGKSTQMSLFCDWLRESGQDVVTCRDPGTTKLGESLRGILLGWEDEAVCSRSELLIYMAARAQLVDEVIRPALDAGKSVVSDRYLLASVCYQGHAGELSPQTIWEVGEVATGGTHPSLNILLDMDVYAAAERRTGDPDRMEARGLEYMDRVRQGFLAEAKDRPDQIAVIDASQDIDSVQACIRKAASDVME